MNYEIRKLLTEKVLGEKHHEVVKGVTGEFLECSCGFQAVRLESENVMERHIAKSNRTFTTPQDAQDVKDALARAGKWHKFMGFAHRRFTEHLQKSYSMVDTTFPQFYLFTDWLFSYTRDEKGNITGYRLCELAGGFIQQRKGE